MFVTQLSLMFTSSAGITVRRGPSYFERVREKAANRGIHTLSCRPYRFFMSKHFQDQKFDNSILYQRVELVFSPAKNWKTCTMPMTTEEMVAKILDELGIWFDSPELVVRIMEDLHYIYDMNEHNQKMYWLINPAEIKI